jgi:Catalytic LigB subunit of aromatic ring-opening dioxygenase
VPLVFAAAASHAPGITAWADAAPPAQKDALYGAYDQLRVQLEAAHVDTLVLLTSEHWTNFFLDHIGAFCVGVAERYAGPVEPWLKVPKAQVPGDAQFAQELVARAYDNGVEPAFAHELAFDHGSMVPLHFLTPQMHLPVVPVYFNTLAAPQPSAARCLAFGRIIGDLARASTKRIGIVATGGMSHDPGERGHGTIDRDFDARFLAEMASGDATVLGAITRAQLAAAGAGAFELLAWIALCGATGGAAGRTLAYEAVVPWATGMGIMAFDLAG